MTRNLIPSARAKSWAVTLAFSSLLIVQGCKEDAPKAQRTDAVVYAIERSVKGPRFPPEAKSRADLAISKWGNGVLDSEPILMTAFLSRVRGSDQIYLLLGVFDENEDVIGFGVREGYTTSNGKREELEETYPVYVHTSSTGVAGMRIVPLRIRTAHQQKDEQLWRKYVDSDYDQLLQQYLHSDENRSKRLLDVVSSGFEGTLPPVWVSAPEPNKVAVSVWIYDKAGNRSQPVKLLDFTKRDAEAHTAIR